MEPNPYEAPKAAVTGGLAPDRFSLFWAAMVAFFFCGATHGLLNRVVRDPDELDGEMFAIVWNAKFLLSAIGLMSLCAALLAATRRLLLPSKSGN
jgi:hypothetical protein